MYSSFVTWKYLNARTKKKGDQQAANANVRAARGLATFRCCLERIAVKVLFLGETFALERRVEKILAWA